MRSHWDERFIQLARLVATWSKDPSTRVGAAIVRPDKTVVSLGYNGFPRNTLDHPAMLDDRPTKMRRTVHAELNAILSAGEPLGGCTLYVSPLFPCANCAGAIIQSGITRVVYDMPDEVPERWRDEFREATSLFVEAGVVAERFGE